MLCVQEVSPVYSYHHPHSSYWQFPHMDSPYHEHLGTNYTPTADEVRGIQLIIDATAQEVVTLDAQIDKVRRQLDSLQEQQTRIHNFGEQHRVLLSPVRRLTSDILEDIFLACLPSDWNPCMSATEAPMLLTQICGSWRQIAMSAPRLWAAIHIVLPNVCLEPYPSVNDVFMHQALVYSALNRREIAVSEWLSRSGVCPLSISLYEVLPWIGIDSVGATATTLKELQKQHLSFIVKTILPYHQQWREFDICLAEDTLDGVLDFGLKAESLKALNSLHITCKPSFYYRARIEAPKHRWKDAVALLPPHSISATFSGLITRSSDFSSILFHAWQGLTELNLSLSDELFTDSMIDVNKFAAEILFHCHSLVTLTLNIDCSEPVGGSRNEMTDKIVLPRVTTLSILLPPSFQGAEIANRLFLPSLMEMNVQFLPESSVEVSQQVLGSLLLSGRHIRTLNLCAPRWMNTSDDLVRILKMAPDLKCLIISTKNIHNKWDHTIGYPASQSNVRDVVTDNLLQSLSPSEDDIICPMLEEFVCSQDYRTGITEGGLKQFLKARKLDPSIANIRRISVFINETKRESVLGEEQISLDVDSALYFKASKPISLSPFQGYQPEHEFIDPAVLIDPDVYTEL